MESIRKEIGKVLGIYVDFMVPIDTKEIPKTDIGKIQRAKLSDRFNKGEFANILQKYQKSESYIAPYQQKLVRCNNRQISTTLEGVLLFGTNEASGTDLVAEITQSGGTVILVQHRQTYNIGDEQIFMNPRLAHHSWKLLKHLSRNKNLGDIVYTWTVSSTLSELEHLIFLVNFIRSFSHIFGNQLVKFTIVCQRGIFI